jgi:hypothetical protein
MLYALTLRPMFANVTTDNEPFYQCYTAANGPKKGKVVPLRSIEAHLGERKYSSYSFLT